MPCQTRHNRQLSWTERRVFRKCHIPIRVSPMIDEEKSLDVPGIGSLEVPGTGVMSISISLSESCICSKSEIIIFTF